LICTLAIASWAMVGGHVSAQEPAAPAAPAPAADHEHGHDAAHDHGHAAHIGEDVGAHVKNPAQFVPDLAIYTFAVFVLLFLALQSLAWPKIAGALDAREAGIKKAIADAENSRLTAETFMKEHKGRLEAVEEQVKEIVAEGRRDAERTKADILKQAEVEAEAMKNRAIAEISRAKDQALSEIFDTLAGQVSAATEHVLGGGLNGADHDRLIRDALNQVSSKA
jgi:F-type H+-transporting ATPase subunit b